jgi:TolA-binding protein
MTRKADRLEACLESLHADTQSVGDGGASRVAIVHRLAKRHQRRRGITFLVVVVGAGLLVPVAHAGWRQWQAYRASRDSHFVAASPDTPKAPRSPQAKLAESPPKPVMPTVVETLAVPAAPAVGEVPAVPPAPVRKLAAPPSEAWLYGRAHDLHFRGGALDKALAAWSAYLVNFPNGQLAPEARFNRAICLVRLKRLEDAKVALADIAANAPASHQRDHASRLLDSLADR